MVNRLVLFVCLIGSFFSANGMNEGGKTKDQSLIDCLRVSKNGKVGYFGEKYIGDKA